MQQPGFRFYSMVFIVLTLSVLLVVLLKTCHKESRKGQESTGMVAHPTATPSLEPAPIPQSTTIPTPTITPDPLPTAIPAPMFTSAPTPRPTPASRTGLTTSPLLFPTPVSASASRTIIYSCTLRKTCAEMSSCEEANFHLHICGNKRLDRDNDGVPCENICPGG